MKYGQVPGVDKPVSRLVMGVDNQENIAHAAQMFDDFVARGGNTFDTAFIYRSGVCEQLLGQWIAERGNRKDVVIIGKGAHTPHCTPKGIEEQLPISLERMRTDSVDIYMLHRDNPEVPVGEFVECLNKQHRAGRIRSFGGSNWTVVRIDEANAYAKKKGLVGFTSLSNNFSLARMVNPIWTGCIAASDPASRAWLRKNQFALMPWSSQARGFFTDRAAPDKTADQELVKTWYSDDNWQRKGRVEQMARKRKVLPINIALAYVLCQPFPTFPLIGPRSLDETRTTWPALDLDLTPEDIKWLNLESKTAASN